ncbi:plasmid maintenance protein CcdB [Salmonella enterica subsp. enterica serovar Sundsvall]|nr:plasmid maintenance protein CcdB [Salmonella enterica subsp. enterica serovar Sundsvall]EEM1820211.1 plasmid maintenance protein CcdB [Salmonella enterica subsp. enterica serovar Abaetetuba]EKL9635043.1 CcdB family protein [Salmonella enterica]ELD9771038.1 CcdB family protein [Salmonella enterica]
MQYFVYQSTGKNPAFPLLLDVTSDIIGNINRRLVIPLMPIERLGSRHAPERLNPILALVSGKEYVLMTHEAASVSVKALGVEVCNARVYQNTIKGALDFMLDGV